MYSAYGTALRIERSQFLRNNATKVCRRRQFMHNIADTLSDEKFFLGRVTYIQAAWRSVRCSR